MQTPLEIHSPDFSLTPAIEQEVRERVVKLEQHYSPLIGCRVNLIGPSQHHRKGAPFSVSIHVAVAGDELVSTREHEDMHLALRDAYKVARRQLEDYARRRRHATKMHIHHPHGKVARLLEDHGYLMTADGREIYFHRNSLLGSDFDALKVGAELSYFERQGDKGPQASTVSEVGGPALAEQAIVPS